MATILLVFQAVSTIKYDKTTKTSDMKHKPCLLID